MRQQQNKMKKEIKKQSEQLDQNEQDETVHRKQQPALAAELAKLELELVALGQVDMDEAEKEAELQKQWHKVDALTDSHVVQMSQRKRRMKKDIQIMGDDAGTDAAALEKNTLSTFRAESRVVELELMNLKQAKGARENKKRELMEKWEAADTALNESTSKMRSLLASSVGRKKRKENLDFLAQDIDEESEEQKLIDLRRKAQKLEARILEAKEMEQLAAHEVARCYHLQENGSSDAKATAASQALSPATVYHGSPSKQMLLDRITAQGATIASLERALVVHTEKSKREKNREQLAEEKRTLRAQWSKIDEEIDGAADENLFLKRMEKEAKQLNQSEEEEVKYRQQQPALMSELRNMERELAEMKTSEEEVQLQKRWEELDRLTDAGIKLSQRKSKKRKDVQIVDGDDLGSRAKAHMMNDLKEYRAESAQIEKELMCIKADKAKHKAELTAKYEVVDAALDESTTKLRTLTASSAGRRKRKEDMNFLSIDEEHTASEQQRLTSLKADARTIEARILEIEMVEKAIELEVS